MTKSLVSCFFDSRCTSTNNSVQQQERMEDRPTVNRNPRPMTLVFNPGRAMLVNYIHANITVNCQAVPTNVGVETNRRIEGRTDRQRTDLITFLVSVVSHIGLCRFVCGPRENRKTPQATARETAGELNIKL